MLSCILCEKMTLKIYKALVILYVINIINSKDIPNNFEHNLNGHSLLKSVETENDAMNFLNQFGYISTNNSKLIMGSKQMKSGITDFQRFMGLSETGTLDKETMHMMNVPRCGVADNITPRTTRVYKYLNRKSSEKRFDNFHIQGGVWKTKNITWKITKYSTRDNLRGKDRAVDAIMEYAFNEWSRLSQLNFIHEKGNNKPMIEIGFFTLNHRDSLSFDGPGRVLAHAYYPEAGDTHFDDDEPWSIDGGIGVDLLSVAVHEFGHALGLGHSDVKDSIMYPSYAGQKSKLTQDDITGIEILYGKNKSFNEDPNVNFKPSVRPIAPDLCTDFRIDAADCNAKRECFFFKDSYIWRIDDNSGLFAGYPKLISEIFPGISGNIDAVVSDYSSGLTYIFRGDRVWTYNEIMKEALMSNQPIAHIIGGLNDTHLNAATHWGFNGKMYLFKDDHYWRFDSDRKQTPISKEYPQPLRLWEGLPNSIDAAMYWPRTRKTYFFKGPHYYRFNDLTKSVEDTKPPFPRESSKWWLKCPKK